jgi:hypothetical protein
MKELNQTNVSLKVKLEEGVQNRTIKVEVDSTKFTEIKNTGS